jgi:hypothetical protein
MEPMPKPVRHPSASAKKLQGKSIRLKSSYGCAAKVPPWKCECGRTTALPKGDTGGICLECAMERRWIALRKLEVDYKMLRGLH